MANVLPPEEKKQLDKRLRARFLCIGATMMGIGAIVALLSLLPALISIKVARASIESQLVPKESSQEAREDQAQAAKAQAITNALMPIVSASTSPSDVVATALSLRPSGLSVTMISFTPGKIVLTGVSARREAVNAYRDSLEESGRFDSVTVPVASLVGTQEGRFTITLSGTF